MRALGSIFCDSRANSRMSQNMTAISLISGTISDGFLPDSTIWTRLFRV